jgi:hypothetical protein
VEYKGNTVFRNLTLDEVKCQFYSLVTQFAGFTHYSCDQLSTHYHSTPASPKYVARVPTTKLWLTLSKGMQVPNERELGWAQKSSLKMRIILILARIPPHISSPHAISLTTQMSVIATNQIYSLDFCLPSGRASSYLWWEWYLRVTNHKWCWSEYISLWKMY